MDARIKSGHDDVSDARPMFLDPRSSFHTAALSLAGAQASASALPEGFVHLRDVDPTILQDMRYAGSNNFTGATVPGYERCRNACWCGRPQRRLQRCKPACRAKGLALKVYDCYRPARAVAAFVEWAKEPDDPTAKTTYYPNLPKAALFPDYIATHSGHSRGATVDLTLVPMAEAEERPSPADSAAPLPCTAPQEGPASDGSLDMGTSFDCFDVEANTAARGLSREEQDNRATLVEAMQAQGFKNYPSNGGTSRLSRSLTPTRSSTSPSRRGLEVWRV